MARPARFRVYHLELCNNDLNQLIARGFLDRLWRDDPTAVERAISALLVRLSS